MILAADEAKSLQLADIHKEYPTPGEPLRVLRGIDLHLQHGQTVAVVGPSGSGKSTLLNIVGTLDAPSAGTLHLGGADPFRLGGEALAAFRGRHIGFVFQDHLLLPQCTALENLLAAPLAIGGVTDDHVRRARDLLDRVGVGDRLSHLPGELSGGERQRVAIARALMNQPTVILADEPTGNLDAQSAGVVGDLLVSMAAEQGAILIVATHAPALAHRMSRRFLLRNGLLREET